MVDADTLRREVLALGLEDDIPLWEVMEACRHDDLVDEGALGVRQLADEMAHGLDRAYYVNMDNVIE